MDQQTQLALIIGERNTPPSWSRLSIKQAAFSRGSDIWFCNAINRGRNRVENLITRGSSLFFTSIFYCIHGAVFMTQNEIKTLH